ncbi:probable RNA-binding protein 18 [Galendromus occidentalis]|uniref:Probable RNA-binding protein 18 n=1 Tax=Galendromus occidentalis TaxID=34638 RepID=A0AAJ7WJ14_9ACAR|nr:probable RNA-binding protein 18 [Galendromus occidentalis]
MAASSEFSTPLPLAPAPSAGPKRDLRRVWIGNIEKRVTECTLLKIFSKHGKVVDFDFLINKTGPQKGLPRGFAFITYENEEQAETAIRSLNGLQLQGRRLSVSFAQEMPQPEQKAKKEVTPVAAVNKDVNSQIQAIEAKLRAMERKSDADLDEVLSASTSCSVKVLNSVLRLKSDDHKKQSRTQKPYQRPRR